MSVEITTSSGISVTVTTPSSSAITVTNKGPKGDTGETGATGAAGDRGAAGADGSSYSIQDGELSQNNFTNDDHNKLNAIEASADVTDTANVTASGALMDSEIDADIKTLSLPASTTITSYGASLVDDADASAARTTLGLGTGAVLNTAAISNGGSGVATAEQIHTFVTTQTDATDADTSGNAATATLAADATTLATPRAINGVNFDGSAAITVTAAGSTLSDTVTVAKGGTGLTTVGTSQILTGNGTGALTSETNLYFGTNRLTIGANADIQPYISILNDENTAEIGVANAADDFVSGSADGDLVITSTGDHNVIIAQNNTAALTINTDGDIVSPNTVQAKTYSYISCGFFDDIGTTLHYLPLNAPPTELTSEGTSYTDWVAPCALTVLSAQMRMENLQGNGNLTMTVWKDPIGSATKASVEAETVAVTSTDDNDIVHFLFDGAAISKGEAMKISLQADADTTSNGDIFVTIVLLMDWNDRYTVSSSIIAS